MTAFNYEQEVLQRYPTVVGGVLLADALRSGPSTTDLQEAFLAEQRATLERLGAAPSGPSVSIRPPIDPPRRRCSAA